jgi:hypothetical protein
MMSSIHLSEDDIDAAEDRDHIGDVMAEAKILEDGEVDEAGGTNAVAIGVGRAVADEIEAELAFGRFDAAVGLAGLGAEVADLGLGSVMGPLGRSFMA